MYDNIPSELKERNQFVCWKYEDRGGPKPTKVPYTQDGWNANVNDPNTWGSFDACVAAVRKGYADGIGFVLTPDDPYCFIDLDAPVGTSDEQQRAWKRQLKIFEAFDSYSEISPGGGLHIVVKAKVAEGRRRRDVELYGSARYMTMTGNVHRDKPIAERQHLVNVLWAELGGGRASQIAGSKASMDFDPSGTDDQVFTTAANAVNGEKFLRLWSGDWQSEYPSQSEADFALIDIIAYYTQNREQITRMFLASGLGKRDKARKHPRYIPTMITRAFDRITPPVDVSALKAQFEAAMYEASMTSDPTAAPPPPSATAASAPAAAPRELAPYAPDAPKREPYAVPPGLVGDIAQYIYNSAPRPVPEIALVAALGLMAGICGRSYNISATGLNQYILVLAPTGCGKEAMASGIERLIKSTAVAVPAGVEFIGPAEIASPQALTKYLAGTANSFVSIVGEIGLKLQQLTSNSASPADLGLRRMLLDLYNKSGKGDVLRSTIYSDKTNNTPIVEAPAFTMLGESTPERFYSVLSEDMVSEGFLPRFTVVEYHGDRPPLNKGHAAVEVPEKLAEQLAELMAYSLHMNSSNSTVDVKSTPEAHGLFDDFNVFCDDRINSADREVNRHIWNRAHLKAMKLAALIAVGINPYDPVIDESTAQWAIQLVGHDATNLLAKFASGTVGTDSDETKQINNMVTTIASLVTSDWSIVAKYYAPAGVNAHTDKLVPYSAIQRRLAATAVFRKDRAGASNAIRRTIQVLVDRGDLIPMNKVKATADYGFSGAIYAIANPTSFLSMAANLG